MLTNFSNPVDFTVLVTNLVDFTEVLVDFTRDLLSGRPKFSNNFVHPKL